MGNLFFHQVMLQLEDDNELISLKHGGALLKYSITVVGLLMLVFTVAIGCVWALRRDLIVHPENSVSENLDTSFEPIHKVDPVQFEHNHKRFPTIFSPFVLKLKKSGHQ